MSTSRIIVLLMLAAAVLGGCGGQYALRAGDQVAAAGGEAPVVVRLLKNDFLVLNLPVDNAAIRFQADGQPVRAAYTDKSGYAAAAVPAPKEPGTYPLRVSHLDRYGREVDACVTLYVWPRESRIVVVRAEDALAGGADGGPQLLAQVRDARVVYWSDEDFDDREELLNRLRKSSWPAGPLVPAAQGQALVERLSELFAGGNVRLLH
jgi:hypothetical protein